MNIELNKTFEENFVVCTKDSAKEMGSGDLLILSTPSLVAFMEESCKNYLNTFLEDGFGSVGSNINIDHLLPTALEKTVTIKGSVAEVIKDKIVKFVIEAFEEDKLIARATHTRVVVNNEKFMSKL